MLFLLEHSLSIFSLFSSPLHICDFFSICDGANFMELKCNTEERILIRVRDFITKCVLWLYEMNKSKHYKLVLRFQIYFYLTFQDICVNYQEKNKIKICTKIRSMTNQSCIFLYHVGTCFGKCSYFLEPRGASLRDQLFPCMSSRWHCVPPFCGPW